jgi:hypothetical protein
MVANGLNGVLTRAAKGVPVPPRDGAKVEQPVPQRDAKNTGAPSKLLQNGSEIEPPVPQCPARNQ